MAQVLSVNRYSPAWFRRFLGPFRSEWTQMHVGFLRRQLPLPGFRSVLDLCAGTGRIAGPLAEAGYSVTAVERDPGAVRRGREAHPAVRFVEADVRELTAVPGPFSAVLCLWQSFGWFDESSNRSVFGAMASRVSPGGVLMLDLYDRRHAGFALTGRRHLTDVRYPDGSSESFDWELFTPDEITNLGRTHGLVRVLTCARWDEGVPADPAVRDFQIVLSRPPV